MPVALIASAAIGAAGSIGAGAMESGAAKSSANAQAQAAENAANLQAQAEANSLAFQKQQWNTEQGELAPFLQSGEGALAQLDSGMGITPATSTVAPPVAPSVPAASTNPSYNAFPATGSVPLSSLVSSGARPVYAPSYAPSGTPTLSQLQAQFPGINPAFVQQTYNEGVRDGNLNEQIGYLARLNASKTGKNPLGLNTADGSNDASLGAQIANQIAGAPTAQPVRSVSASSTTPAPQSLGPTGTPVPSPNTGQITNTAQPVSAQQIGTASNLVPTSLNESWSTPFTAPTAAQAAKTPGYQFQLQQGEQAIQRAAAAQGNLLTGGTLKDLNDYAQGVASENYNNVYNQALQQYQNAYNIFQNNQNNQFNRLSALSGTGQTTAAQLGNLGAEAANTNANTNLTGAQQVGSQLNNAAAATASGYVGSANALGGALQGGLSNMGNLIALSSMLKNQNANPSDVANLNPYGQVYA